MQLFKELRLIQGLLYLVKNITTELFIVFYLTSYIWPKIYFHIRDRKVIHRHEKKMSKSRSIEQLLFFLPFKMSYIFALNLINKNKEFTNSVEKKNKRERKIHSHMFIVIIITSSFIFHSTSKQPYLKTAPGENGQKKKKCFHLFNSAKRFVENIALILLVFSQ